MLLPNNRMKTTIIVFHIILLCLLSLVIPLQLYKYGACKLAVLYVFTRGQTMIFWPLAISKVYLLLELLLLSIMVV